MLAFGTLGRELRIYLKREKSDMRLLLQMWQLRCLWNMWRM